MATPSRFIRFMTRPPGPSIDVAALYERHAGMVYRRIRRFYSHQEAEEVLQEVFERVMRNLHSWRGTSEIASWLYSVTTRHCLNRLRDDRRRRELLDQEAWSLPWTRPVARTDTEARLFLEQLWRQFDEEIGMIGILYYVDGMTQAQIGAELGVTGRTVSNRLARLRELAAEAAGDEP